MSLWFLIRFCSLALLVWTVVQKVHHHRTVFFQFNSIELKKTLIIPQGAILLWSWRARKKQQQQHKVKRTIQQTQHHFSLSFLIKKTLIIVFVGQADVL